MPTDPRHHRHIPGGQLLARLLQQVWARQLWDAHAAIRAGKPYDGNTHLDSMVELFLGVFARYAQDGGIGLIQRLNRRKKGDSQSDSQSDRAHGKTSLLLSASVTKATPPRVLAEWNVFRPETLAALRSAVFEFCRSTNATTNLSVQQARAELRRQISEGLDQGEALAQLTVRVQRIYRNPQRAQMIAATEASRAMHAGQMMAAQQSGGVVTGLRWLASADACSVCEDLDGRAVPLGGVFMVQAKGGPYAVIKHPPAHPNCMCAVTEVVG